MSSEDKAFATADLFKPASVGISCEESTKVYDEWTMIGDYDQDMNDKNYKGPAATCEAVEKLYPSDRENVFILDVACGTGIVGAKLQKKGFKRIHAFDASTGMLDRARLKKVYEKLFFCFLDASPLPMESKTYDCAVISGGMCEGHIPTAGLRSLIRVIKPGGTVVIVMREAYLYEVPEYKNRLEKEMTAMENEGLWCLVSRTLIPNYYYHHMGVTFIFRLSLDAKEEER